MKYLLSLFLFGMPGLILGQNGPSQPSLQKKAPGVMKKILLMHKASPSKIGILTKKRTISGLQSYDSISRAS